MGACDLSTSSGATSSGWLTPLEPRRLAARLRRARPIRNPCRVGACASAASPADTAVRLSPGTLATAPRRDGPDRLDRRRPDQLGSMAAAVPDRFPVSLIGLPELLRHELLYALIQRDTQRPTLSPIATRLVIRGLAGVTSIAALTDTKLRSLGYDDRNGDAHWNDVVRGWCAARSTGSAASTRWIGRSGNSVIWAYRRVPDLASESTRASSTSPSSSRSGCGSYCRLGQGGQPTAPRSAGPSRAACQRHGPWPRGPAAVTTRAR